MATSGRVESLGFLGGDNTPLHGKVSDGDWFGLGSRSNLELANGEENPSRDIWDDVVGDNSQHTSASG